MASKTQTPPKRKSSAAAFITGLIVAVAIMVLTIIEYYLGVHYPSVVFLMLISVAKSLLVLYFFMHIYRLWRPGEEH